MQQQFCLFVIYATILNFKKSKTEHTYDIYYIYNIYRYILNSPASCGRAAWNLFGPVHIAVLPARLASVWNLWVYTPAVSVGLFVNLFTQWNPLKKNSFLTAFRWNSALLYKAIQKSLLYTFLCIFLFPSRDKFLLRRQLCDTDVTDTVGVFFTVVPVPHSA